MTVVHPNHITGINSITVATGEALSVHKNDGSLIRTIVSNTGISTFHAIEVSKGGGDLTVGVSTLFADNSTGRIGIGTVVPIGKHLTVGPLQETGTDRSALAVKTVANSLSNGEAAIHIEEASGTEGYFLGVDSSGGLSFTNSGTSHQTLYLGDDNKIGIGTNTASDLLTIVHQANAADGIQVQNKNNSQASAIAQVLISGGDNAYGSLKLECNGTNHSIQQDGNGHLKFVNASTERLRLTSSGDVSISGDGTVHGVSKLTLIPANRTTAFDASDGDTWHDIVLHQGGGATNNAIGIAFEIEDGGTYHKNAGTGIAAVKNGINNDYGSDLVFITRPQSSVAVERVRITSDGRVRIGASVDEDIHTGEGADLQVVSNDAGGLTFARDDTTVSNGANLGVIRAYGNDNDGTYQEVAKIEFQADLNHGTGDKPGRLVFSTTNDGASSTTEKMRITSDGTMQFGYASNTDPWSCTNDVPKGVALNDGGSGFPISANSNDLITCILNRTNGNGIILEFKYNGSTVGSVSSNANSLPSDRDFKTNISDLNLGLSLVNKLKPSQFNYKIDAANTPVMYGLIAQELEEAITSEGITKNSTQLLQHHPTDDTESNYDVDYLKLVPILINSIKELSAEVETLKTKVAALESA